MKPNPLAGSYHFTLASVSGGGALTGGRPPAAAEPAARRPAEAPVAGPAAERPARPRTAEAAGAARLSGSAVLSSTVSTSVTCGSLLALTDPDRQGRPRLQGRAARRLQGADVEEGLARPVGQLDESEALLAR